MNTYRNIVLKRKGRFRVKRLAGSRECMIWMIDDDEEGVWYMLSCRDIEWMLRKEKVLVNTVTLDLR